MYNWALLSIAYMHFATSITITVTTNLPVHLTMYWTSVEPVRHRHSIIRRGLNIPWGAYFCFVAWNTIEQVEPGDTLTHTFIVPDWEFCQTRYFTFIGTVGGNDSPSIGPLFTHHHSGEPPLLTEEQTTGILWSSISDWVSWGQRLTINNRLVSKLSFYLARDGFPAGEVWYRIRRTSDGAYLFNQKLMNSVGIEIIPQWYDMDISPPLLINEEVEIEAMATFNGAGNLINIWMSTVDVKPGEFSYFRSAAGVYIDHPTWDFMYKYTYQQY